jgi:mRNA interferase MazF
VKPWQVWWADLDPAEGHEQAGTRPVLVVSSPFHLAVTGKALATVLPLTTRERPGWLHRIAVKGPGATSYVITEQVRTVAVHRLSGPPQTLAAEEIADVRRVLAKMLDL